MAGKSPKTGIANGFRAIYVSFGLLHPTMSINPLPIHLLTLQTDRVPRADVFGFRLCGGCFARRC
eukprot:COSAG01_NODE_52907_length_343_cov_0.758197_1_plen_64_part_10